MDFLPLINRSDKVLCIYRENWYSQIRSILYQSAFDEWQWQYKKTEVDIMISDEEIYEKYHKWYKSEKKHFQDFIKHMNLPSISYEKLYYQNGVSKIKEIFNLTSENKLFDKPDINYYLENVSDSDLEETESSSESDESDESDESESVSSISSDSSEEIKFKSKRSLKK